ncbi:MAG: transketolase [Cyclonatronaceae bacterium]
MSDLEQRCVNTIRTLSMDAVQAANSGHPGMPMGMADVAFVLWTEFIRHNPNNPRWLNRDRFILSAGHGSMLLYSLLHLTGYPLPLEQLRNFRQWDSLTPGHPEAGLTAGVETTTGPLGQGFANGVGMALAEAHLAARFNRGEHKVVDHYTYAIVSDGDLMEGISHEAASLAGHLKLEKLIYLYDANSITIDGSTDLAFTEDVAARFRAYGWHVQEIDGHDRIAIRMAVNAAKASRGKPSLVVCRTKIGFGSPNKEGTASSHGSPLGDDEIRLIKTKFGFDPDKTFHIDDDVLGHFRSAVEEGSGREAEWSEKLDTYKKEYPDEGALFEAAMAGEMPADWAGSLPVFPVSEKGMATRQSSGNTIDALEQVLPTLLGGSADLTGSNNTKGKKAAILSADDYAGSYIHYGVREHAMVSMMNGMALHGGVIPFGGTFLVFSDYCRPAIRLAALSHLPVNIVFTHDSIGLGEDGPTHQPVEHLAALRVIPNLFVVRPADANETAMAWRIALERKDGPTALILTRQALPTLDRSVYARADGALMGGYILAEADTARPDVILLSTGSEVHIALEARKLLAETGIQARVVSMPCIELFEMQDDEYKNSILPADVKVRVAIEAASTYGWDRYTGNRKNIIGIDRFGASAPYQTIYEKFGLTPENVVNHVKAALKRS